MTDQPKSTFARRIRDDAITGLCLRVFPSGVRTFALNRMVRGRRRYATIGNADTMSVPEARELIAAFIDTVKNNDIAHAWFQRRRRDANRADEELSNFVAADDFDHWTALNLIAARLHRDRERFPDALAEWAAELHEGKHKPPPRERGDRGGPPYAQEDRNRVYYMADIWLQHYAMTRADDRIEVIARYIGDDGSVVRKGLTRWRNPEWRRAPWPRG